MNFITKFRRPVKTPLKGTWLRVKCICFETSRRNASTFNLLSAQITFKFRITLTDDIVQHFYQRNIAIIIGIFQKWAGS